MGDILEDTGLVQNNGGCEEKVLAKKFYLVPSVCAIE